MSEYTGVKVLENLSPEVLNKIHNKKVISTSQLDGRAAFYPHMFLVLKATGQQSALARVGSTAKEVLLLDQKTSASGIEPRNKEQIMAMNVLMDDEVPLNIMTGRAGTGKTLLSMAVALEKIEQKKYKRLILTRPMSQVGKRDLGALPGDVGEKFGPYLNNYYSNLEYMVGPKSVIDAINQYKIEFIPLQLMRGTSFFNAFIIADEVQVLDHHEMLTLGTRMGEGCKLVVMGDLNQRDENIAKNRTGIYKLMQDNRIKESSLASAIELIKIERSALSRLFAETFDES